MKTVWRQVNKKETDYVYRCSKCGGYKEDLYEHWFFTGLYCVHCIKYGFYDDTGDRFGG